MLMMEKQPTSLIERLPAVRGRLSEGAALAGVTWFRVGGPAEVMFRPADQDDLLDFLRQKPDDLPITVIGVGSNLLVRDGGIPGVTIRLGRPFAGIKAEGSNLICGASALDVNAAKAAQLAGIAGLEFLCGVPGTVGGGLRMNAGAYGKEFKDVLLEAEFAGPGGELYCLKAEELGFSYRHADWPEDWICLGARLAGSPGDRQEIAARMAEIQSQRSESQPVRSRTGGSTFRNPPGEKAWQLIDRAGCRGLTRGDAMVSEQHCNFLINSGEATAADLEGLGEEVRRRVKEATGITLTWEIRRVGQAASETLIGRRE